MMLLVKTIKTRVFLPPKDDLFSLIKESIIALKEKSIIVFTSKLISIWQGRCLNRDLIKNKDELIKKEAELYLERATPSVRLIRPSRQAVGSDALGNRVPKGYAILTIKNNTLIPSAGIDESNGRGFYILWPKSPFSAAKKIYKFIKKNYHLKKFGIIISDSHCIPMRAGTLGISIAYYGFHPLKDYRGKKDIFGRKLKISRLNIADSLAAIATLAMGEGKEQTPIAIIENLNFVKFDDPPTKFSGRLNPLKIKREEDIYGPLIGAIKWKKTSN